MNDIDLDFPRLEFSNIAPIWRIYRFSWQFPKPIRHNLLKQLLTLVLESKKLKFRQSMRAQEKQAQLAQMLGIPIEADKISVPLRILRDFGSSPLHVAACNSGRLNFEYTKVRAPVTIEKMIESARVFSEGQWRTWKPVVFSDNFLHFSLLWTTNSYYLTQSDLPEFRWKLHFRALEGAELFEFGHLDTRKIYLNSNDTKMLIVMSNGDTVTNGDRYWDIAKVSAASTMLYYAVMYGHNWAHVHYPDVVVAKTYSMISQRSQFFRLMEPHIRYVLMTTQNGLSGRATAKTLGVHFDYLRPDVLGLTAQPETAKTLCQRALAFTRGERSAAANDILDSPMRLGFPHEGFQDRGVPYLDTLHEIYQVIRRFVELAYSRMADEHLAIQNWKEAILRAFPQFVNKEVNTVDFIATFIWHSSFIHSLDHETGAEVYMKYGHTPACLRKHFDLKTEMSLDKMVHPADLCTSWCAANSFMAYTPSPIEDDSMAALDYRFSDPALKKAQEDFKKELNSVLTDRMSFHIDGRLISFSLRRISTSISF